MKILGISGRPLKNNKMDRLNQEIKEEI